MKWTTVLLAAALPSAALADPDRVSILLGSEHINAKRSFNEYNPGVVLTWEQAQWGYSAGLYYNSYEKVSAIGAVSYSWRLAPEFDLGVFGALALYPGDGEEFSASLGDVVPLAGVQARYRNVFVQAIPSDGESLDGLVTFGLTFSLD